MPHRPSQCSQIYLRIRSLAIVQLGQFSWGLNESNSFRVCPQPWHRPAVTILVNTFVLQSFVSNLNGGKVNPRDTLFANHAKAKQCRLTYCLRENSCDSFQVRFVQVDMSSTSEHVPSESSSTDASPAQILLSELATSEGVATPTAIPPVTEEPHELQTTAQMVAVSDPPDTLSREITSVDQITRAADPELVNDSTPSLPTSPSANDGESIDRAAPEPVVTEPVVTESVVTELAVVNPAPAHVVKPTRRPELPSIDEILEWLVAIAIGIWLLFTILYSWDVSTTNRIRPLFPSVLKPAQATLNLRILSEGVTYSLSILLAYSTTVVQWAAASTKRGITFSTWLAMSPATDYWGLFHLVRWKRSKAGRDLHFEWIFAR
jgi:hypothetical protein